MFAISKYVRSISMSVFHYLASANIGDVFFDDLIGDGELLCNFSLNLCFHAIQTSSNYRQQVLLNFGYKYLCQLAAQLIAQNWTQSNHKIITNFTNLIVTIKDRVRLVYMYVINTSFYLSALKCKYIPCH